MVRIFSTNLSEYCKHDGCPKWSEISWEIRMKDFVPELPHSAQLIIFSEIP